MLQDLLLKAVDDTKVFHIAEAQVADDKTKLATDEAAKQAAADIARSSVKDAISALTTELAEFPGTAPVAP